MVVTLVPIQAVSRLVDACWRRTKNGSVGAPVVFVTVTFLDGRRAVAASTAGEEPQQVSVDLVGLLFMR
jgi:hypothetical protein